MTDKEELKVRIKSEAESIHEQVWLWRTHIHAHPELSFQEENTTKYIESELKKIGISDIDHPTPTGLVAHLYGLKNSPESAPVLALRADIDALPIFEKNNNSYRSKNEGVMHACGHDVHTSSLLGTALILYRLREQWSGHIKLIFQPGEEKMPGGAKTMIESGVLKNPDIKSILGQHVYPRLTAGKLGFRKGMYMASCDELYIRVIGKGGHAALPDGNIDPVLIGSHLVSSLQQLVSRRSAPDNPTVLSIGKFIANGATNVIPDEVTMEGTFRAMNEEWRSKAHMLMAEMVENLCKSMGAKGELNIVKGYPFLENEPELTGRVKGYAEEYLGKENVVDLDIWMGAEDFSYYTHETSGCFYRFGTASEDGSNSSSVHTPTFDIDPKSLITSTGFMAWATIQELNG